MKALIALDIEPSQRFVDEISKAWDEGDAVLPIDQRLPIEAKKQLIAELKPTVIVSSDGPSRATMHSSSQPADLPDIQRALYSRIRRYLRRLEQVHPLSTSESMTIGIRVFHLPTSEASALSLEHC